MASVKSKLTTDIDIDHGGIKMNVKELKEKLSTFPDDMEVMTKKTELLGTVGYIFSVKQDSYALFGVDIPCVLISDESSGEET